MTGGISQGVVVASDGGGTQEESGRIDVSAGPCRAGPGSDFSQELAGVEKKRDGLQSNGPGHSCGV